MWRSRLYSDVRISLTGNFGGNHENTTAIFSSHRFILVSRSSYFHTALISWPSPKNAATEDSEPPMLTFPSPPLLQHRCLLPWDLFIPALLSSLTELTIFPLPLQSFAQLYIFPSQPSTAKFKPVSCRKCCTAFSTPLSPLPNTSVLLEENGAPVDVDVASARHAPRVLEFALEEDVKNTSLERGACRALVGLFGEGWCTQEFADLP
jgi:hypothetical protein